MFARHLPFRADVRESSRRQPFPAAGKWQVWGIPCTIAVIAACSQEATQSCNSCHDLEAYGVDGARTSTGNGGARGTRNAPTVYNAAGFVAQFWDGRAATVEEQAKGPILNSSEMAMRSPAEVMTRVSGIPGYEADFKQAFSGDPDPMTFDNLANAIGAFERKLVTPGRWDRFLDGDTAQLSPEEKAGLKTFLNVGCMVCHTGPFLGGSMFAKVGLVEPWPNQVDMGRFEVTKDARDKMYFKVPTLRNIEKTAPYFHDGSGATLEDAVKMMGQHQLGIELSPEETGSIVTWLRCLTGELPKNTIARPEPAK
jgi:cytochrome c peroxidase